MSKRITYVRPDLTALPAILQEKVIRKFLSFELIPAGWHCQEKSFIENIRSLYKTSNLRIQYYGSPENLEKFLFNFINFPGSQQFFQFDDSVFYKTNLSVYHSLGGNTFIYKKDMYELLFEYIPRIHTLPSLQKLAHSLMNYYLRTMKRKLTTSHEMIDIDDEFRGYLCRKQRFMEEMMETGRWKLKPGCFAFEKNGDILDDINEMLMQTEIKAEMGSEMRKTVTMVTKEVPVNEHVSEYRKVLTWLYFTIGEFAGFIKDNKSMMLSRSETVDSFPTSKIPIRLFENDQEKLVMSHELLHAIKTEKFDVSGFEDKILAMPKLSAMSFREVFGMIPSNIFKMLEFIRIPMSEVPKELPIYPTIDGSYCLSPWQFLVMILGDAILFKKLFQGLKKDKESHIMETFHDILVDTLCQGNYFVSFEKYEETKLFLGTWFKENFPSPNQKEISKVNKNGFTDNDLKKQLERLELSEVFPNIGNSNSQTLENPHTHGCAYELTRQMLYLIENYQLSYVFEYLSKRLINLLHERKWCGWLDDCSLCSAKIPNVSMGNKTVKEEKSLNEDIVTLSDTGSSNEAVATCSTSGSDDSKPECPSFSATVETVVSEKQESVRKPKKSKKKMEQPVVKPVVKESQACPKCVRASEYTKTTNEKLRLSKIEVKHLKKELSVAELALEEKNELIRILEEKLRENEHQLSLKSSEVETLNTKKQEMERKNERNEKLIATFNKVNSKKDFAIKSLQSQNFEKDKLIEDLTFEKSEAIPSISPEESEKIKPLLSNLLETKTILSKEDPIKKSGVICEELIAKTNSEVTQQIVKYETKIFQLQVSSYGQIVENNIRLIRGNNTIKFDQIPNILDFPEFSEEFKIIHKSVLKKEAPILCRKLLKLTDEISDMECVICINEMESHDGTTKCAHCKRRFHNHCIKSWLKKKSICPTCKHGMVDEQEFPAL